MRSLTIFAIAILVAGSALAVAPGTDVYLASVGHGQGACVGGICSQWATDAWIFNPTTGSVTVTIAFLPRGGANPSPATVEVTVAAGETKELKDLVLSEFVLDQAFGALRFTAATAVVVTGRIYDANVVTNKGTGTAGQFFPGLPAQLAIGLGQSTDLIGLAQDQAGTARINFGFVETTGNGATVEVTKRDASGAALATKSYALAGYEATQVNITDVGGALGTNQRLTATVTAGSGRVLAFGSQLDNNTGDPYTVEMVTPLAAGNTVGSFDGIVLTDDGQYVDGGIDLAIDATGLLSYSGLAGLPCGWVVDFFATPLQPIAIAGDGSFSTQVTIPSYPGTTFSITWTLSGTLASSGVITGTLRSDTTGATGVDVSCNGLVDRPWRAGWTGSL